MRFYTLTKAITNPSTSNVVIEIAAPATFAYLLKELGITQSGSTTSAAAEVKIQRLSAAASAGTALAATDFGKRSLGDPNISLTFSTTTTAYSMGSAGTTTGAPLLDRGFNVLNGFWWCPTPELGIEIAPSGLLAIYMPVAPANTYIFDLTLAEIG